MSAHTKTPPTSQETAYKVIVEMPGNKKILSFISEKNLAKLEDFLEKYGETESTPWRELAKDRIAKYGKAGIVLRGARYRAGLSQKALAELTNISQNNISKIENGKRTVGEQVAKKLAKALKINFKLLTEAA